MLEAEVKIPLDPAGDAALRARLAALGATALPERAQADVYFAHPTRDFAVTDEALRLRNDDGHLRITYKGPRLDPPRKTREEIEIGFAADAGEPAITRLLERLGFRPVAVVRKRRSDFHLGDEPATTVSLDRVEGIGVFCEIEVAAASVEEGRERLEARVRELGLENAKAEPDSYLELLLARRSSER